MWHVSPVAVRQPCELLYTCYSLTYLLMHPRYYAWACVRMSVSKRMGDIRRMCSLLADTGVPVCRYDGGDVDSLPAGDCQQELD